MSLGRVTSMALVGVTGIPVDIEVHAGPGLPGITLIGLPDRALGEATERVRAALVNSGFDLPAMRLTINLSPASLPKQGSGFDLGIALAILVATGVVPSAGIDQRVVLGELALDGRLRPTRGVLPSVLGASRAGWRDALVPVANQVEASMVSDVRVVGAASLRHAAVSCGATIDEIPVEPLTAVAPAPPALVDEDLDLADVVGNIDAVDAMVVAAAGGHHMLMVGPPGAGKTMIASRMPTVLPPLSLSQALEVACVRSLDGEGDIDALPQVPPFVAPHHTASAVAMVGGGGTVMRPGAVTRASGGILFLDEAPEFHPSVLDCLRQPLETGRIVIHRAAARAEFPAACQLVLAANPCPCGHFGDIGSDCTCPPTARRRYFGRLSGPLLDRVDIRVNVARVSSARALSNADSLTSAEARQRVISARRRAVERWQGSDATTNARVPQSVLSRASHGLHPSVTRDLDRALERGFLTRRGYDRIVRMTWTLADLDGVHHPTLAHVGRAMYLRQGVLT